MVFTVLSACSGAQDVDRFAGGARVTLANGPISNACKASGRKGANQRVCGCIQSIANGSLTSSDQRLAAGFYKDPQKAQTVKMSKSTGHDAFWDRYKVYASRSERICKGL